MNALIIESQNNQIQYTCEHVQPLPIYWIIEDVYEPMEYVHKIGYPHFEVKVEKSGSQFSECYQAETHQRLLIKNEFLYQKKNKTYCLDDYTDFMISALSGEYVKLLGVYDEYAYVIYKNQVGWIKYEYLKAI